MSFLVPPCASLVGERQPRTHYQVLGISRNEQDPRVIEEAALRCTGHLRAYQLTSESEVSLRLNEIAQALIVLLDPAQRREYDRGLDKPPRPAMSERWPPGRRDIPVLLRGPLAPPTPGEDTLMLLHGDGGTCDVTLVCRKCALRTAGAWTA